MSSTWSRVEVLDEPECMRLLASVNWGRFAWSEAEGARILPVNYSIVEGVVYLRTDLYGSLADAGAGSAVALEADELDDRLASGWSVVVLGRAEQVHDIAELADLLRHVGEPWVPGSRPLLIRIVPTRVTGRRFLR